MAVVIKGVKDPQFSLYANIQKGLREHRGYPVLVRLYTDKSDIDFETLANEFFDTFEEPLKIKRKTKNQVSLVIEGLQINFQRLKSLPPLRRNESSI